MTDSNWHQEFFSGIALDLWRDAVPQEVTDREIAFLVSELDLQPGHRVLDVPCGLGRHALGLAQWGALVTGVDGSTEALDEGRRLAAERGLSLTLERRDMRELPFEEAFDAVCCLGNSFGYVAPEETARFLSAVARSLVSGGRFVLHTGMASESILPNFQPTQEALIGEIRFAEENRYDVERGCIETRYTFERGDERKSMVGYQWVFSLREIRALLAAHGLEPTASYGGFGREPFALGGPELVMVARKR